MATSKLSIDLTDKNKKTLERIKAERKIPYGTTINSLIDTFCNIPETVKKELLVFIGARVKELYKEMEMAEDYVFNELSKQSQAYMNIADFLNTRKNFFAKAMSEQEQLDLSDMLDNIIIMYENGFFDELDAEEDRNSMMHEFKPLYEMIKMLSDRNRKTQENRE